MSKDMKTTERQTWTLNPARNTFLFEPGLNINLSVEKPHFQVPEGLSEEAEATYKKFLDGAVKNEVLLEGKVEIKINKPELSGASVNCEEILSGEFNVKDFKTKLSSILNVGSASVIYLPNGKIRNTQADLEALIKYETEHRNRADVRSLLKRALEGQIAIGIKGGHLGGISNIEETIEKRNVKVPLPGSSSEDIGGDPFGD